MRWGLICRLGLAGQPRRACRRPVSPGPFVRSPRMLRKVVCLVVVLSLSAGVVFADQFGAFITKVDGNKVTFYPFNFKDKQKGEEKTMKAAKDVKVIRAKFNKETKTIEA